MNEASTIDELSELEQIEFNRRLDIALATIDPAAQFFGERAQLDEQIKAASKSAANYWPWAATALALWTDYFIRDGDSGWTWAAWLGLMAFCYGVLRQYDLSQLKAQRTQYNKWLLELEVAWCGAVGDSSGLWELAHLMQDGDLDRDGDKFQEWWLKKLTLILERVCGIEKGRRIGAARESAHRHFRLELGD